MRWGRGRGTKLVCYAATVRLRLKGLGGSVVWGSGGSDTKQHSLTLLQIWAASITEAPWLHPLSHLIFPQVPSFCVLMKWMVRIWTRHCSFWCSWFPRTRHDTHDCVSCPMFFVLSCNPILTCSHIRSGSLYHVCHLCLIVCPALDCSHQC